MKSSVFVGTSLDGFIARRNGDFDFLPEGGGEPHGYDEFMASIDVLVIDGTLSKIPLFGSLPHDIQLRHVQTRSYPSGLVKSEYEIVY